MSQDNPAVAQAIVVHAEALCEREDHLWDVIGTVGTLADQLTDTRQQGKVTFGTDEMVRAFLYMQIRDFSQNELATYLEERPILLHRFGFDVSNRAEAPTQQAISEIWENFSDETQQIITAAAKGIGHAAVEHDVISEALIPYVDSDADEDDETDDKTRAEQYREKATGTIKLARKHAFPEFESGRTLNRTYDDEQILEMIARICMHNGSANSEGEYGWLTDDESTASGSTILRVIKQFATAVDDNSQLTLEESLTDDQMPKIDSIRDELMASFDGAVENIIRSLQGAGPFSDRRKTAAIDITYEQVHIYPWQDKEKGIAKPGFPRMVSGYKKDDTYKRGYKYATITLAGDLAPIIFGVEPVKENSKWEEDDAPSYSRAEMVDRLLAKAEKFVDIDEVYLDRGFHSKGVYAAIEERGIIYTTPVPKYEDDLDAIKKIRQHPNADAAVKHDLPVALDGEVHHYAEYLYVPSRSENGTYAVFTTNREHVETDEIEGVCRGYRRRWDIENQYKSIGECLPRTSSTDYRVRFCTFVLTTLMYNLWRLTDYLIKVGRDIDIRSPPEIGFNTFVRAFGNFLRDIG